MILFKGAQCIEPCYDGYTLGDARAVAGDGLSVISVKLCHRHCHFTQDPESDEPLISCVQGLQPRNTYMDIHRPDLRKVRGLECATTGSVTDLIRSHIPENKEQPTVRRRLFKILESLVATKSTKLPNTMQALDRDPSLWPANICVLPTCPTNADKNIAENESNEGENEYLIRQHDSQDGQRDNATRRTIDNSCQLSYEPLKEFNTDGMFLEPTCSGVENYAVNLSGTNGNQSNLNLERKPSLTWILEGRHTDQLMEGDVKREEEIYLGIEDFKTQNFRDIRQHEYFDQRTDEPSRLMPTSDSIHLKQCESLKSTFDSLSEDLDEIISYITNTNEVVDIFELENIPTGSQQASNVFETSYQGFTNFNYDENFFQTDKLGKYREIDTSVWPLNLEEQEWQRQNHATNNNSFSNITINHNKGKRNKNNHDNLSMSNYYEEETFSKYSYWEDDDLRMELSTKELFVSNIQGSIPVKSKDATALVPQQYFNEFWEDCALPYTEYFKTDHTAKDSFIDNQLHGYFHWESMEDENILEEAEHIMHAINKFLDTNIGLTSQGAESVTLVGLDDRSKFINANTYVTLTELEKSGSWKNLHENEEYLDRHVGFQELVEYSSNQSLYDSPLDEVTYLWLGRGQYDAECSNEPPALDVDPENAASCRSPYSNEAPVTRRNILQKTQQISQEIEDLKNCIQEELAFSSLGEKDGKHDKNLKSIYHHESKSKEKVSRTLEESLDNKYDLPVNIDRNHVEPLHQTLKDFQQNSSYVNEFQVTRSDKNQEYEIDDKQQVNHVSSMRLDQRPVENDCKDKVQSQFIFSSPQMPINLTNPLNNTTYK